MTPLLRLAGLAGILAAAPAAAVEYNAVLTDKSQVTFTSRQMNVPVDGLFKQFDAQVTFDPAKPEAGKAVVEIDLNSIDAGSDDANAEVKRKPWFDTQNFPTAKFVSTGVKALGNGRFEATGKMTIKGRTHDVVAPFTFRPSGSTGQFDGSFVVKRLQFAIGEGPWADTSTVADEVVIKFKFLVAAVQPAAAKK
ncbi:MAG: YceI family protein [Pseudomonadota bacterium]|jgi:polyisoprenoid-binding protein YceI